MNEHTPEHRDHGFVGIALTRANNAARPVGYATRRRAGHTSNKSLASTTMIFSGLVVLVFVPIHLWTFKFGAWYQTTDTPPMLMVKQVTEMPPPLVP